MEEARELLHPRAELLDRGARYVTGAPSSALRPLLGPGPPLSTGTVAVVESILLVPTPQGWRVRLLHRSAVP